MDAEQLRADIERDRKARQDEILFYQNQVALAADADAQDSLRRALVLLLYAHYEGFTKFSLTAYVAAINSEGLKCSDVNSALAAASMTTVFKELRNPQSVGGLFKGQQPDDSGLARFARERQFIERAYELLELNVHLADEVIETEWNLKPPVLRKLLYRLGLNPDAFSAEDGHIEELVNRRNNIAHGSDLRGVDEKTYIQLRDSVFKIMGMLTTGICDFAGNSLHLKLV